MAITADAVPAAQIPLVPVSIAAKNTKETSGMSIFFLLKNNTNIAGNPRRMNCGKECESGKIENIRND